MNSEKALYNKINDLIPDLKYMRTGDNVSLKATGLRDLNITILWGHPVKTVISLAHDKMENGDFGPDPEMEIAIYPQRKTAEPLSRLNSAGFIEAYPTPDITDVTAKADLNQFLNTWLNTIKSQGYTLNSGAHQKRFK